jgi:hypothetical protein
VLDLVISSAALRFLVPVALRGLGSFAGRTLFGTQADKTLGEAAKAAIGPSLSLMASHAMPAATRLMGTYVPSMTAQQQQQQQQQDELQGEKQRGGGTLFGCIEGIPTTTNSIKKYKRGDYPTPNAKRKPAASARFNY